MRYLAGTNQFQNRRCGRSPDRKDAPGLFRNSSGYGDGMDSGFDRKYDEQYYHDKERRRDLPRITLVDMDGLAAKKVQVEQLKMLHHLDASVMSLARTLDDGISATPYGFADWMDSLGGTVSYVRDSIDQLRCEQRSHTKALNRIASALERLAPPQTPDSPMPPSSPPPPAGLAGNDVDHDNTEEEYEEFQEALERND